MHYRTGFSQTACTQRKCQVTTMINAVIMSISGNVQGSSNLGLIPEVVTTWEQLESIEVFLGCILPMNDPFVYCNVFFFFLWVTMLEADQ